MYSLGLGILMVHSQCRLHQTGHHTRPSEVHSIHITETVQGRTRADAAALLGVDETSEWNKSFV